MSHRQAQHSGFGADTEFHESPQATFEKKTD